MNVCCFLADHDRMFPTFAFRTNRSNAVYTIHRLLLEKKKPGIFRFQVSGGERGIRTLERVLAVTRFPIVRLRPTQPSLHILQRQVSLAATRCIIAGFQKVSSTFKKNFYKFRGFHIRLQIHLYNVSLYPQPRCHKVLTQKFLSPILNKKYLKVRAHL